MLSTKRYFGVIVPNIKSITGQQLREKWNQVTLIDVRERHDIEKQGKIKNAVNIPFEQDLFSTALSDMKKTSPVVFYSNKGHSSYEASIMADKLGFSHIYQLEGGLRHWKDLQPFMNNHSPWVHSVLDTNTETAQYIVTDIESKEAYIINPVLDYDPFTNQTTPLLAKSLLQFIETCQLQVTKIIDTHIHHDHLSAAHYLQENLSTEPEHWVGDHVTETTWTLGKNIHCSALPTPGHTPACMAYRIGDAAFVGDTLLMPDIGTARCDTTQGNVVDMYHSIQRMYNTWPNDTRIFVGHDYPPKDRPYQLVATLEHHKKYNTLIHKHVSLEEFIQKRKQLDATLKPPRLIPISIQTHLMNGKKTCLPELSSQHKKIIRDCFKVPEYTHMS